MYTKQNHKDLPNIIKNLEQIHIAKKQELRQDGLTEQEGRVMDALVLAWNEFVKLNIQHPSDKPDFCHAIHECQQILCMRILQRDYPDGYPMKRGE